MNARWNDSADHGDMGGDTHAVRRRCLMGSACCALTSLDASETRTNPDDRCDGFAHPGAAGCRRIVLLRGGRFDGQDVFVSAADWISGVYTHDAQRYLAFPSRSRRGTRVFVLQPDAAAT